MSDTASQTRFLRFVGRALLLFAAFGHGTVSHAQDLETTQWGISINGNGEAQRVEVDEQRRRGLVTVAGGCSGTLLNRWWVLTARHCVTVRNEITGNLQPASNVTVEATWAPGRVASVSRIQEFSVNLAPGSPRDRDIVLLYLADEAFGPVYTQEIYEVPYRPRLTNNSSVVLFGQGFGSFASGDFLGTPPATPSGGLGIYRRASFSPSNINATHFEIFPNSDQQVGAGGDSGGPVLVNLGGSNLGIAGVQSTCIPTGYVANAPTPLTWLWATGISSCQYVSTEPFYREIVGIIGERPYNTTLFQMHSNGSIFKYDGNTSCGADGCFGWTLIDHNPATLEITPALGTLVQRQTDGSVWRYDGQGRCDDANCPGWKRIDANAQTKTLAGDYGSLFQILNSGVILKYDGFSTCADPISNSNCSGWTMVDHNAAADEITVGKSWLYKRHADGSVYKFDGRSQCGDPGCPGWIQVDHNPMTVSIAGSSVRFYQLHSDGRMYRQDSVDQCTPDACTGWNEIDRNGATRAIFASDWALYQLHANGTLFKHDGTSRCTADNCGGWTMLDNNPATHTLAASGDKLFQLHSDGQMFKYDNRPCDANGCPGWIPIDRNPLTVDIVAIESF